MEIENIDKFTALNDNVILQIISDTYTHPSCVNYLKAFVLQEYKSSNINLVAGDVVLVKSWIDAMGFMFNTPPRILYNNTECFIVNVKEILGVLR